MNDEFYDKVYEAWKNGENADLVSKEKYDDMRAQGLSPDEISWKDLIPKKKKFYRPFKNLLT